MPTKRVSVTGKARNVIDELREKHGELIFHQSGGCCDGSAPMCFQEGDFLIGSRDLCLGEVHGCKFYMASDQFEYYIGGGSLAVPFTHKGMLECVKNDGIFGQGKNNPQFIFGDHALVKHSTGIYDPSYGAGPEPDLRKWEDKGIAGIGIGTTPLRALHSPPGSVSPGNTVIIPRDIASKLEILKIS